MYNRRMDSAREEHPIPHVDRGAATLLLSRVSDGDSAAAAELLPLVYDQLRAMAGAQFRGQHAGHTLQPTALVHEAYLKIVQGRGSWNDRAHFCAVAATAMRQILMNHARAQRAAKRSAKHVTVTLDYVATPSGASALDLVALDDALAKLKDLNERYARLVELRIFGGLTAEDMAPILGISAQMIRREWRRVRAWLARELDESGTGGSK